MPVLPVGDPSTERRMRGGGDGGGGDGGGGDGLGGDGGCRL